MGGMHQSRRPYIIGAAIFVVVFAIGALLLASTGGGPATPVGQATPTPTPSATSGTPTAAPKKDAVQTDQGDTVVELRFSGDCEGCLVTATQTDNVNGEQEWTATIADGVAQIEAPTPNTYGMYFRVEGTTAGEENGTKQLIVLAPDGKKAGAPVEESDVTSAAKVKTCWAGTTLDTAVVRLQVKANNGEVRQAWADPALPTVGKNLATDDTNTKTPNCA